MDGVGRKKEEDALKGAITLNQMAAKEFEVEMKDPGGLSFSMNNVLGYQLMFLKVISIRNRRNRMFGVPHELSHHQVVQFYLGLLLLSHIYARRFP